MIIKTKSGRYYRAGAIPGADKCVGIYYGAEGIPRAWARLDSEGLRWFGPTTTIAEILEIFEDDTPLRAICAVAV